MRILLRHGISADADELPGSSPTRVPFIAATPQVRLSVVGPTNYFACEVNSLPTEPSGSFYPNETAKLFLTKPTFPCYKKIFAGPTKS